MKKAYITGITGTVAPYLKEELSTHGYVVYDKHIRINSDKELETLKLYLNQINPDYVFHLALGPISFSETLARYCKINDKTLVYISTVSVFEDNEGGPYYPSSTVTVTNEYGKYKYECEQAIMAILPSSYVIRIGWQISDKADSKTNNMFRFIKDNLNDYNEITVSDQFYPSTSYLHDTVEAIRTIVENNKPDLYFVNSNLDKSLFDIITMLNESHNMNISVKADSTFSRNDIMIDERVLIKKF